MIWTNAEIEDNLNEAENVLTTEGAKTFIDRYSLTISEGVSLYQLPEYCIDIRKIMWLGYSLDPFKHQSMILDDVSPDPTTMSRPYKYVYSGFGTNVIKFLPAPAIDLAVITDCWDQSQVMLGCVVEFYRKQSTTDSTFQLPSYLRHRLCRYYILWQCFMRQGPGQDLVAAEFYRKKFYSVSLPGIKAFRNQIMNAVVYVLGDANERISQMPHKPVLPSRFYEL